MPSQAREHSLQETPSAPVCSSASISQIPRPFLTPPNPPLQRPTIPNPKLHLEPLRLCRQARLDGITLQRIQDRAIPFLLALRNMESGNQTDEGGVELAIGEVRADAHARAGAVGVVRGAAVRGGEVAGGEEGVGVGEVGGVVVGGVGVLRGGGGLAYSV